MIDGTGLFLAAAPKRIVNPEATALSPTVGWLLVYLNGREVATVLRHIGRALGRLGVPLPAVHDDGVVRKPWAYGAIGRFLPEELLVRTGNEKSLYTACCAKETEGQLPNEIRARHGLPLLHDSVHKRSIKRRKQAWEKKRAAAKRGGR